MKYEVINLKSGRVVGKYVDYKMALEHAEYIRKNGGQAEVRRIG